MRSRRFPEEGSHLGSRISGIGLAEMLGEIEHSKTKKKKAASVRAQDIPDDVKRQRNLLNDFYTAWKKNKFGPTEEAEDAGTSTAPAAPSWIERGIENCKELSSVADDTTSQYSQLSTAFLVFANAYPKHAPTCYALAESCFTMATVSSRLLSASWKLTHGFTLSLKKSSFDEIEFPLRKLMLVFQTLFLSYHELYSKLVDHVTVNMTFERDEEFQLGYEQPPTESQISAFVDAFGVAADVLKKISEEMRQLAQPEPDRPKQEAVSVPSGSEQAMEVAESQRISDIKDRISLVVKEMSSVSQHLQTLEI
jgi:hypothetical protein